RLVRLPDLAADARKAGTRGLVFLVDIERCGVGAGRLLLLPEALVSEPAARPSLQAQGLDLHGLVEIARRRLGVADCQVAERARHPRLGLLRGQPNGRREVVDSNLVLMLALIEQAAIVVGLRIVRLERDHFVEVAERLHAVALLTVNDAA